MKQNLDEVTEQANELSLELSDRSRDLVIDSTLGLEIAAEFTRQAKDEIKNIEHSFKPRPCGDRQSPLTSPHDLS